MMWAFAGSYGGPFEGYGADGSGNKALIGGFVAIYGR